MPQPSSASPLQLSPAQIEQMINEIVEQMRPTPFPSPEQLFDHLMSQIEPELMTSMVPTLATTYANETPAEARERSRRYQAAFAEYDKRYAEYAAALADTVHAVGKGARVSLEQGDRADEEGTMDTLFTQIEHS